VPKLTIYHSSSVAYQDAFLRGREGQEGLEDHPLAEGHLRGVVRYQKVEEAPQDEAEEGHPVQ
jgi:hypothetical protein